MEQENKKAEEAAEKLMKEMPWIIRPYDNGLSATKVILMAALTSARIEGRREMKEACIDLLETRRDVGHEFCAINFSKLLRAIEPEGI